MEYMDSDCDTQTQGKIHCCKCGLLIEPNPSNMCVACLRSFVDITEGIPKELSLYFCKGCERYQQQQGQYIVAALESRELLSLCLKKIKALSKVNLVDAAFVWTEPHSKRVKVKLTVQKEVLGGTVLQQVIVVEYVVHSLMCDNCHRREAKDFWRALVQVRQKTHHKKTFFYLEQLLLKHKGHNNCVNIKSHHEGLDFFFDKRDDARKMVDFLQAFVPCRYVPSQQLISHDTHNNTYNYKYTFSVEIVPICKDDIVCLPQRTAQLLGNIGQLCIAIRVTNLVYLIDPFTLICSELSSQNYFRHPFRSICGSKQLTEYTVMDVDIVKEKDIPSAHGHRTSIKHVLADVWLMKSSELGSGDQIHTRTHLGHLLNPGDIVLGFDLRCANVNEENFEKFEKSGKVPDVIIVKKHYGDKSARNKRRLWKLKRLAVENVSDGSSVNRDYIDFMEDLEEDPMLRQNVNIYSDKEKMSNEMAVDTDELDESVPKITLQEMLDDLNIND